MRQLAFLRASTAARGELGCGEGGAAASRDDNKQASLMQRHRQPACLRPATAPARQGTAMPVRGSTAPAMGGHIAGGRGAARRQPATLQCCSLRSGPASSPPCDPGRRIELQRRQCVCEGSPHLGERPKEKKRGAESARGGREEEGARQLVQSAVRSVLLQGGGSCRGHAVCISMSLVGGVAEIGGGGRANRGPGLVGNKHSRLRLMMRTTHAS